MYRDHEPGDDNLDADRRGYLIVYSGATDEDMMNSAIKVNIKQHVTNYSDRLAKALSGIDLDLLTEFTNDIWKIWHSGNRLFICGNGGSAGNAIHLANDFLYGIAKGNGRGLRVTAIPANQAVMTCLANDISYADIFSEYLSVHGEPGDILLVLSGSGNSPNILKVIEQAGSMDIKSYGILGYSGGKALEMADRAFHVNVADMQISEDAQLIIGHMVMQILCEERGIQY